MIRSIRKRVAEWLYPEGVTEHEDDKHMLGAMCYIAMMKKVDSGKNPLSYYVFQIDGSFSIGFEWRKVYSMALEFNQDGATKLIESYNRSQEKDQ